MFDRKADLQSCLLTIGLLLLSASQTCLASQSSDYLLKQKHGFNGIQNLYIGKNKWRLDNVDLRYSIIANGESGKISVFNLEKKLRFESPLRDFHCQTAKLCRIVSGENLKEMKWSRIGDSQLPESGKNLLFQTTETRTYFHGSQSGGFLSGSKYFVKVKYTVWISSEISISKQLSRILAEFQGTPDLGGVPIKQITEYSDKANPRTNLETILVKRERHRAEIWRTPELCLQTRKLADVVNTTDESMLKDLIGN